MWIDRDFGFITYISGSIMEYVEEVNDEKCVLMEFPNENGNVAVGYLAWLSRKEDDIQNIIKNRENVVTRWPKNCTIGPVAASKIKV